MLELSFQDRSELLTHYGDQSRIDSTLQVPITVPKVLDTNNMGA